MLREIVEGAGLFHSGPLQRRRLFTTFDSWRFGANGIVGACKGSPNRTAGKKPQQRWPNASPDYPKGPGREIEEADLVLLFAIEASQPDGAMFRMAFGCNLHPLASWIGALVRLF